MVCRRMVVLALALLVLGCEDPAHTPGNDGAPETNGDVAGADAPPADITPLSWRAGAAHDAGAPPDAAPTGDAGGE